MSVVLNLRRLPEFTYLAPQTLSEALGLLEKYKGKTKLLAGGTDLLVRMKERWIVPEYLISLNRIPDLNYIRYEEGRGLRLGALTTHQAVSDSSLIKAKFNLLAKACRKIATPQIRNRGTIGGNLCNACPSADTAPPLLALDAKLKLLSSKGEKVVPLNEFITGPFTTQLKEGEILAEIQVPDLLPRTAGDYHYLTKITEVDETLVGAAVLITIDSDGICQEVRIGLGSVDQAPMRAVQAESVLRSKKVSAELISEAARHAAAEVNPRSRAPYRREMTEVMVRRALSQALKGPES